MNFEPIDTEKFLKGKRAAVCFTIDDLAPVKKSDCYDCGGDLFDGPLGRVKWLMERHPQFKVTLFTTANWEEIDAYPTRKFLAKIPWLREKFFLGRRLKRDSMRLSKHPEFVKILNETNFFEIAYHGLYHCHKGLRIPVEFQDENFEQFDAIIKEMIEIFDEAGLRRVNGICPPGWNAPEPLLNALVENSLDFVASSRDVITPISSNAMCSMSGLKNVPLIFPCHINNKKLVHFPTNFQATSRVERAFEIIDCGGLLSIKAHIVDCEMLDSVKDVYMNYLDLLLTKIEDKYGDDILWTTMGEMSDLIKGA